MELTLRIVLQKPTQGVVYGLQKGRGSNYETVQKQISESNDLTFEFNVDSKHGDDGKIILHGPFAQGTPKDRFVYIDIGTYAGQKDSQWSRRLKIPLTGINTKLLDDLSSNKILVCKVPGTGKDGSPNCATVKPFNGWIATSLQ